MKMCKECKVSSVLPKTSYSPNMLHHVRGKQSETERA